MNFSAGVFQDSFKSLRSVPDVVYPSLYTKSFDDGLAQHKSTLAHQKVPDTFLLLSINRYERKKNLELALKTLGTVDNYLAKIMRNNINAHGFLYALSFIFSLFSSFA